MQRQQNGAAAMSVRGIQPVVRESRGKHILVLCHEGSNRSVTIASSLKYAEGGQDVLTAGLQTNSRETLAMLFKWADRIILTDSSQRIPSEWLEKARLWDVGPDTYPRPHNKVLLGKARALIALHKGDL
jgi:hypothetical protein